MGIELTDEQEQLVKDCVHWYHHSSDQIFEFSGPAGTGKSVMLHIFLQALKLTDREVAPMAYTGSAAMVMRLKGFNNSKTMHSWLYKLETVNSYDSVNHKVVGKKKFKYVPLNSNVIKLIIVDEGSMIPLHHRADILRSGIKVVVTGDLDQLPPVGDKPGFLTNPTHIHFLTKIMRQESRSPIVYIANMLKHGIEPKIGIYGNVQVIPKSMLTDNHINNSKIIICGTNRTRDRLNDYVRKNLYGIKTPYPQHMEKLVCRKNDWLKELDGISLVNGMTGTIMNHPSVSGFSEGKFIIDFRPDLFPQLLFEGLSCDYNFMIADSQTRMRLKSLNNPNPEIAKSQKFENAYAITTHISQGSQYTNGIYISEWCGGGTIKLKVIN